VKDQANCGSCWAFSTTGAIESAHQIASGKLVSLSEQNLVSCSFNGNLGCGGGEQSDAFCWTYHNKGLCSEADWPYTSGGGQDGFTCFTNCTPAVTVSGYKAVPKGNEKALMQALLLGPVSIGVDAAANPFMLYKKGIINAKTCGKQIDHAILLVGFGTGTEGAEKGIDYWKIKNSWNTDWGEEGYLRIARGSDICAVADGALYPTGVTDASKAAPSPPPTTQCPAIAPPPPNLPEAYTVNVTQTWGDPTYPDSGMFKVSNQGLKLANSGYMMLEEEKLYRCDLNPNGTLPGHEYDIKNNGKRCDVDPTKSTEAMQCPWSRWNDEIMSQLITAAPVGKMPCPRNPYVVEEKQLPEGMMCNQYLTGKGTDFTTTYWLAVGSGIPVKENQVMTGKGGFTVTSFYSDFKVGEPPRPDFAIPKSCKKPSQAAAETISPQLAAKREIRGRLRRALAKRAVQLGLKK